LIIAGNTLEDCLARLDEFWRLASGELAIANFHQSAGLENRVFAWNIDVGEHEDLWGILKRRMSS
jgi:hypothetical protein